MVRINEEFLRLPKNYLFSEIAKRVIEFQKNNPERTIIKLGIGDCTRPICDTVIKAMHVAVDEMAEVSTFKGYGPEQGYSFLIDKIIENDYIARGVHIETDEVFVSDGTKCDIGNFGDILGMDNTVAITDPVYPVYVDTNMMCGRKIVYLPCNKENDFIPELPNEKVDIIYLCLPNNPTGTTLSRSELKKWVDYAKENKAIILYDAAYEAYISDENIVHTIYEIEGAIDVAIEFRSFSKNAGFTGLRCGFTVVPKAVKGYLKNGQEISLNSLWNRRHTTKFNGTSYVIQRGAEAVYSLEGKKQIKEIVSYYMENARIIREGLQEIGINTFGGINSPYIWLEVPSGLDSWQFFDKLLNETGVVGTPGVGFGKCGEGYFRLTGFGSRENTIEALRRIKENLK